MEVAAVRGRGGSEEACVFCVVGGCKERRSQQQQRSEEKKRKSRPEKKKRKTLGGLESLAGSSQGITRRLGSLVTRACRVRRVRSLEAKSWRNTRPEKGKARLSLEEERDEPSSLLSQGEQGCRHRRRRLW
jgi:hypothetical protein